MTASPLGQLFTIRNGPHEAVIQEVGATLRSYSVDGDPVVRDFARPPFSDLYRGGHGQILMPWVNRVDGGKYTVDGTSYQLALSEPPANNASHGFVRFSPWDVVEQSESSITLGLISYAQMGFPFIFEARVTYSVSDTGLAVQMSARNLGDRTFPFGMGTHPYFTTGSPTVDEDVLLFDAAQYLPSNDRGIPEGKPASVDGTPFDFRNGKPLRDAELNVAVCGLRRDNHGIAKAVIQGNKRNVTVWMSEEFDYVMVFTGDTLSVPDERRRSIAIEPMTCAADAYNNGLGLKSLSPGEEFSASWGVELSK